MSANTVPRYRGRFAPTPSGPLHLGSLLTAVASFVDARSQRGDWLLRIDDLDAPRCVPGADSIIRRQLEAHGLHWDETPRYQTQHQSAYEGALLRLRSGGYLYACRCTRAQLAARSRPGPDTPVYAGTCRSLDLPPAGHALRFIMPAQTLQLDDAIQGKLQRDAGRDIGDFIVRRRDGIIGYHLACVVDEHEQGISDVVRGADLIGASFAQLALMQALDFSPPRYAHVPVLVGADGRKLSKQNHAAPLEPERATDNLWRCLQWLQQDPPMTLRGAPAAELLAWGIAHWRRQAIGRGERPAVGESPAIWHDAAQQMSGPEE